MTGEQTNRALAYRETKPTVGRHVLGGIPLTRLLGFTRETENVGFARTKA